jgi:hypothetical protein
VWPAAFRAAAPIGAVLAVLSLAALPAADAASGTKLWVAALHLLTGAAYVGALRLPRRSPAPAPARIGSAATSIKV